MAKHAAEMRTLGEVPLPEQVGIRRLASTLYEHVYGERLDFDGEQAENYMADAAEIAESHPHLLNAWERGLT